MAWADNYDIAVLVSSDQDFVPVAEFLETRGIKIIHGAFHPLGAHLTRTCWGSISVPELREDFCFTPPTGCQRSTAGCRGPDRLDRVALNGLAHRESVDVSSGYNRGRRMVHNKYRLLLGELTIDQIERAKVENGPRKQITHVVMVPGVGQRFGTLTQCTRYYDAWNQLYPLLLQPGEEARGRYVEIDSFETDPDLSLKLAELHDSCERALPSVEQHRSPQRLHGSVLANERERPASGCAVVLVLVVAVLMLVISQIQGVIGYRVAATPAGSTGCGSRRLPRRPSTRSNPDAAIRLPRAAVARSTRRAPTACCASGAPGSPARPEPRSPRRTAATCTAAAAGNRGYRPESCRNTP